MSQTVRLIRECPSIENTIPYAVYQSSSPKLNFLEEDKLVIYSGGSNYMLSAETNIPDLDASSVSLFILNTSVVIWFNNNNIGLDITYPSIIFHGLNNGSIYINIEDNNLIGNYITITSNTASNNWSNPLFNDLSDSLKDVYNAISYVADMYVNDDDDDDEESDNYMGQNYTDLPRLDVSQALPYNPDELTPKVINNTGQADDLDDDNMDDLGDDRSSDANTGDNKYGAGMHVDVGYASIAGTKTRRESDTNLDDQETSIHQVKRNKLG